MVPLVVVAAVVCHKLIKGEVLLILPGIITRIAYLLGFHSIFPLAVESADTYVVAVDDAPLLGSIEVFRLFLL